MNLTETMKHKLFQNHILVNENDKGTNQEAVYLTLIGKFGVKIADEESFNKLHPDMFNLFEKEYGRPLGEPFYRNFPESVKTLSDEEMIIDRILHYMQTYGADDFETRHFSLFEGEVQKIPFKETYDLTTFKVVDYNMAVKELYHIADTLLMRRQISNYDLEFIIDMMDIDYMPSKISSKQIMTLLIREIREKKGDLKVMSFIDKFNYFELNDILRLIGWTNADKDLYHRPQLNKLNLSNKDRKFYTALIEHVAARTSFDNIHQVLEKRKNWKGLLHHIHFKGSIGATSLLASIIFDDSKKSIYSRVEKLFAEGKIIESAKTLVEYKGATSLLRNINRYISTVKSSEELSELIDLAIKDGNLNPIAAMQFALSYIVPTVNGTKHTFSYNYYGRTINHVDERKERPIDSIGKGSRLLLASRIKDSLKFKNTGKKIYIDPKAENYAIPIWIEEIDGIGVMPTGSRIDIPDSKVVRVFVYWEKERDLDLSSIAISREHGLTEFSWRNGQNAANFGITFSGDVTDGVNGGAEYFDIDFDKVQEFYPDFDYLIFNVNNFSGDFNGFSDFTAKAGFMTRDKISSGEIFEPKTVKSSYNLTTKTRQVTMFALDIKNRQVVWINKAPNGGRCAGDSPIAVYLKYIDVTKLFNLKWFFENIAGYIVTDPESADIIVSDDITLETEGKTFVNMCNGNAVLEYLKTA